MRYRSCMLQVKTEAGWEWVARPSMQEDGAIVTTSDVRNAACALDKPWFERIDVANEYRLVAVDSAILA